MSGLAKNSVEASFEKRFAKKVKISAGMSKELFTCCKTYFYIEKSEQILVLECFDY